MNHTDNTAVNEDDIDTQRYPSLPPTSSVRWVVSHEEDTIRSYRHSPVSPWPVLAIRVSALIALGVLAFDLPKWSALCILAAVLALTVWRKP